MTVTFVIVALGDTLKPCRQPQGESLGAGAVPRKAKAAGGRGSRARGCLRILMAFCKDS